LWVPFYIILLQLYSENKLPRSKTWLFRKVDRLGSLFSPFVRTANNQDPESGIQMDPHCPSAP